MTTISKLAAAFIPGYPGHEQGPQTPRYVVMHGTVSPTVPRGARATATYFASATSGGLAHYIVDPAEIIATCDEGTACWHSGHNADSIGIELCDPQAGPASRWQDSPHLAEEALAAKLVADICARHHIPVVRLTPAQLAAGGTGIVDHNTVRLAWPGCTDHVDVGPDFPWARFLSAVKNAGKPAHPPMPAPRPGVIWAWWQGGTDPGWHDLHKIPDDATGVEGYVNHRDGHGWKKASA